MPKFIKYTYIKLFIQIIFRSEAIEKYTLPNTTLAYAVVTGLERSKVK